MLSWGLWSIEVRDVRIDYKKDGDPFGYKHYQEPGRKNASAH